MNFLRSVVDTTLEVSGIGSIINSTSTNSGSSTSSSSTSTSRPYPSTRTIIDETPSFPNISFPGFPILGLPNPMRDLPISIPRPISETIIQCPKPISLGKIPPPWDIRDIKPVLQINVAPVHISEQETQSLMNILIDNLVQYIEENPSIKKFVILVHGFRNDVNTEWINKMERSINKAHKDDKDVITGILGWGKGCSDLTNYEQAVANTQQVGKWIGNIASKVKSKLPYLYFHGIGHSLGAQVLGCAGRENPGTFDRISGLDPAGPYFEKEFFHNILSKSDAKFVDVIHTDGYFGGLSEKPHVESKNFTDPKDVYDQLKHFGTMHPCGHVDFYPNLGYEQPKTNKYDPRESHSRAHEFFQYSVENQHKIIHHFKTDRVFRTTPKIGTKPEPYFFSGNEVQMGYFCNPETSKGNYYLELPEPCPPFINLDRSCFPQPW